MLARYARKNANPLFMQMAETISYVPDNTGYMYVTNLMIRVNSQA